MIKYVCLLLIILYVNPGDAQAQSADFDGKSWEAPYTLPKYEGWDTERFQIPISFAPKIPYEGVEDIRFTPGWSKKNSGEYWSYAFLWFLKSMPEVNTAIIEKNLEHYYTGLIGTNIEQRKIPADKIFPTKASIKIIKPHREI